MALAFDAVGAGANGVNVGGSPVSGTAFSHTAALGADVFLWIQFTNSGSGTPSSVQYNGVTMTLVDSQRVNNLSTAGGTFLYRSVGGGTGGSANFTYTVPAVCFYRADSVSYTGVDSGAPTVVKAFGSSTTASSGSVTVAAGQIAVGALGWGNSGTSTMGTPSGGSVRVKDPSSGAVQCNLAIVEATTTATFSVTWGTTGPWSSLAIVLSPAAVGGGGAVGWIGPVNPANRHVGPMALRRRKRLPVVNFLNSGLTPPVAFDQSGAGYSQIVGNTTTGSWTDHATQGSYVVAVLSMFANIVSNDELSGVTCGGVPMQRLGVNYFGSLPGLGGVAVYGLANVPGGPKTIQFTTLINGATSNIEITANSFSFTGVQSVSPFLWPVYGNGSTFSQSVTNASNSMVLQIFGANANVPIKSIAGGDIRWNASVPATNVAGLAVQTTSVAGATSYSAATTTSTAEWCGIGLVLSPLAASTYSPAMTGSLTKFAAQQNVTWQFFGDSTTVGFNDGGSLSGWVGRWAIKTGKYYDYNVKIAGYSGSAYGAQTTLRSSPRGGSAPTLLIYDGGVTGSTVLDQATYLTTNNAVAISNPDLIVFSSGINEALHSWFNSYYVGLYGAALGYLANYACPNVPIIVTTENTIGGANGVGTTYASFLSGMQSQFSALGQALVGQNPSTPGIPFSAPLILNANNNVSLLDTQQAFHYQCPTPALIDSSDGVHPNAFGYDAIAEWVASILMPQTVNSIGAGCPPVRIANPRVGPIALRRKMISQRQTVRRNVPTDYTGTADSQWGIETDFPKPTQKLIITADGKLIVAGSGSIVTFLGG